MSFSEEPFHFATAPEYPDPSVPLRNLDSVRTRMDSLQLFLTRSINANALITRRQMDLVAAGISSAVHDVISNGAALIACSQLPPPDPTRISDPIKKGSEEEKQEGGEVDVAEEDSEVVEVDVAELLAEHVHYCEICGKGFKRDANLRMHMRAHGNQFKTIEALAKPPETVSGQQRVMSTRFSCPYLGCNRNKGHAKFRAVKSVVCLKNHFKRSHCPKMYSCNRCGKKSFSVVADLKSHLKHCGEESRWQCTCGTRFSRKSKLFGHMALFEGHMPAVEEDDKGSGSCANNVGIRFDHEGLDHVFDHIDDFSNQLFGGFESMEGFRMEDMFVDLEQ